MKHRLSISYKVQSALQTRHSSWTERADGRLFLYLIFKIICVYIECEFTNLLILLRLIKQNSNGLYES